MKGLVEETKVAWRDSDVLILRCRGSRASDDSFSDGSSLECTVECQGFFHVRGRSEGAFFNLDLSLQHGVGGVNCTSVSQSPS